MRTLTPWRTAAALVLLLTGFASQSSAQAPAVHREAIEWCDVWMPNMNGHDLPRVMLIGDSITRGYFPAVEENLKGRAYVARIATSKALGDAALFAEIGVFLQQARFDVVHVNIGMHGWAYSEEEYKHQFPALLGTIRKFAPGAKILWASTTPVRKDRENGATNGRIAARNGIARERAALEGVPVDDLHALMSSHPEMHTDDVHFSKEGYTLMAEQVERELLKALPAK
ncbi:MAG: SGNH/GDSL hydrolase family protein [Acidobacteriota bacterium]